MRRALLTGAKLLAVSMLAFSAAPQAAPLTLDFSTYFGGPAGDHIRDVVTDAQGNIYFVGGSNGAGYPTTAGAFDTTHNGDIDVVVTKLDPTAQNIIWSTYIGGPSLDRAYAVEVDSQGYVYVGGRAGTGFPTTAGAIQTQFRGGPATGPYPSQDKFVAKLTPDGSSLVYCTYFGAYDTAGTPIRDIDIDANGNCYIGTSTGTGNYNQTILNAFQNGFDSTRAGGNDGVVAKISPDGTQCLWATYLGGSGFEWGEASVRTDPAGNVYYLTVTDSTDIPTTAGAYDRTFNGGFDFYVAKINANGTLGWATYLGGSDMEHVETHELEIDSQGNVIVASGTKSSNYPTTAGAYDRTFNGNGGSGTGDRTNYPGDVCVSKLSADGSQLLASTFVGGRYGESGEGVGIDAQDNIYLAGAVYSDNFPTTAGAFQSNLAGSVGGGNADGFLIMLSADLSQLLYGTYMGTASYDALRTASADSAGNVLTGSSTGASNWPIQNAIQPTLQGPGDHTLVRFSGSSSPSPGSLRFSGSSTAIAENGGSATITVTRNGGSAGAVGMSYATSNGTATAGQDYSTASGSLSWADGETASKTFTVFILDDGSAEANETINLALSGPTGGASLGTPSSAIITIIDDDGASAPLFYTTLDNLASVTAPASGTGAGATVNTAPADDFIPGQVGNGIRIDAAGESVRFAQTDGTTPNIELDQGTLDFWYQPNYSPTDGLNHWIFGTGTPGAAPGGIFIRKSAWDEIEVISYDATGAFDSTFVTVPAFTWTPGQWVNLRITWDFTVATGVQHVHIYVDGVEPIYTGGGTGPRTMGAESAAQDLLFGNRTLGGSEHADGIIDEVRIYNTPLSPGSGVDVTPPVATITSPTSASTYATSSTPVTIGGTATDNVGVVSVTWSNAAGGNGTATGTANWTAPIALASGLNSITVTAWDAAGNSSSDTIDVTYSPGSDSDGDGLPDSWENQYFGNLNETATGDPDSDGLNNLDEFTNGTDPTNPDTDGDGLTDGAEVNQHGTDPLNPDSDGDGFTDGQEIAQGTDPLNASSFPGSGGGGGGGGGSSGGCGATGIEFLAVLALAALRRRRAVNK